ncbi:hypothetical protein Tco_0572296 [Tanacetum coccineum]
MSTRLAVRYMSPPIILRYLVWSTGVLVRILKKMTNQKQKRTKPDTRMKEHEKPRPKNLVPIPRESDGVSDDTCDVPFCDNSPPLDVLNDHFEIFSDSNDDCTSSDNDSFKNIDYVEASPPEDSLIMGNEELSTIPEKESDKFIKSSVGPCSNPNVVSILEGFTDELPLEENDDLFDLESNKNEWKKILYDDPIYDLIFDPGDDIDEIDTFLDVDIPTDIEDGYHDSEGDIHYLESLLSDNTILSLHLRSLTFEDRHYLSFTYVIRTFLPYFTYPVIYPFPLSSESEDIIFDPDISAFHLSLEPVAFKCPMEVCSSTCFIPNFTMIWGESS